MKFEKFVRNIKDAWQYARQHQPDETDCPVCGENLRRYIREDKIETFESLICPSCKSKLYLEYTEDNNGELFASLYTKDTEGKEE